MKTRNLLLGAFGLLLMASCTKDEVVDINRDGDEIAFNVVTNADTRVFTDVENGYGGVYCNVTLPKAFKVWATTADDQKTYINGDVVENKELMMQYSSSNILQQAGQSMLAQANQTTDKLSSGYKINRAAYSWRYGLRYWPGDRPIDFYAAVDAEGVNEKGEGYIFHWNNDNNNTNGFEAPTIDVVIPKDAAEQKDVLYAVTLRQHRDQNKKEESGSEESGSEENPATRRVVSGLNQVATTNPVVNLNFRHALSQVVFTAQNPNKNLYVEVKGVSICNVNSKNTFTYPSIPTAINVDGHTAESTIRPTEPDSENPTVPTTPLEPHPASWGTWAEVTEPVLQDYELTFAQKEIPATIKDKDGKVITEAPVESLSGSKIKIGERTYLVNGEQKTEPIYTEYYDKAMLLLPQKATAWDPNATTGYLQPGDNDQKGAYFLVDCVIVNIAGTELNRETDIVVWGGKNSTDNEDGSTTITYTTKKVAIPVALNWQQGKKYVYNFVFGAFGGYNPDEPDPEPNPNPEDPDLVPIVFKLTVDEFEAVNSNPGTTIRDTDLAQEMVDYNK